MRALIVGDIHLHRKRLARSTELLNKIKETVFSENPDMLVLLGDVFDHHREMYSDLCTIFHEFLSTIGKPVYILVGNHDMHDSRTFLPRFHALQAFKTHPNVIVCDTPMQKTLEDGSIVGFIPFVPNGKFLEATQMLEDVPHLVFAHQEFKDCLMSSFKSEHGDSNPEMEVISGHVHGEQNIGKVWYPGTPCQQNFGEDPEKFVHIIEISGGSYKVEKKIDLLMPQYITIRTSCEEFHEVSTNDGNSYRIVVSGPAEKVILYKQTSYYKTTSRNARFKFEIQHQEAVRKENERELDFEQRFSELVKQSGLQETYEAIFTEL